MAVACRVEAAEGVLESIEGHIQYSAQAAEKYRKEREEVEARTAATKATIKVCALKSVSAIEIELTVAKAMDKVCVRLLLGPGVFCQFANDLGLGP